MREYLAPFRIPKRYARVSPQHRHYYAGVLTTTTLYMILKGYRQ